MTCPTEVANLMRVLRKLYGKRIDDLFYTVRSYHGSKVLTEIFTFSNHGSFGVPKGLHSLTKVVTTSTDGPIELVEWNGRLTSHRLGNLFQVIASAADEPLEEVLRGDPPAGEPGYPYAMWWFVFPFGQLAPRKLLMTIHIQPSPSDEPWLRQPDGYLRITPA